MRASVLCTFALAAAFGLCLLARSVSAAHDSTTLLPAKLHPWGLFDPGAWKTVRVVAETLDEQGQVCSTTNTDTKTTLVDIDRCGVTLEIQACIEVAGKRFEAEPQVARQGFHGELAGPNVALKPATEGEVVIEGKNIPCKVQQLVAMVPNGTTTTTLYYSTSLSPYLLKRESVTTDPEGQHELSKTRVEVVALDTPLKVRGETKNGVKTKTVYHNDSTNSTVTTLAEVLPEVPGGVVRNSSQEVDKSGRLVRRSSLELVDSNTDPAQDRTGMFGRKRPPRHRSKQSSHYGS